VEGEQTILSAFKALNKKHGQCKLLGTSDDSQAGRPYKWKTRAECEKIAENLARGFESLNLCPEG